MSSKAIIQELLCPVCQAPASSTGIALYDDRYGFPGTFNLLQCTTCKHTFIDAAFSSDDLKKLYTEYYPRSSYNLATHCPHGKISWIKSWITGAQSLAFRWVAPDVRVLDIGCGFGEALGYHRSRGCDAYGVEADENVAKAAEKFGYNIRVGLFDSSLYEKAWFDYVTMDQVIEHVSNPVEMLADVGKVLKPGGLLVMSTPNPEGWGARIFGSYWAHWHIPYHQHFFSHASMLITADRAGFELVSGKTVTHSCWLRYQWAHLFSRPRLGTPSPFWSPKIRNSQIDKFVFGALRLMHYSLFNHLVTRFADICNVGDNRIFVFRKKQII